MKMVRAWYSKLAFHEAQLAFHENEMEEYQARTNPMISNSKKLSQALPVPDVPGPLPCNLPAGNYVVTVVEGRCTVVIEIEASLQFAHKLLQGWNGLGASWKLEEANIADHNHQQVWLDPSWALSAME